MSKIKKKKKKEEPKEEEPKAVFCQHCKSRQKGGFCETTQTFVPRKQKGCEKLVPKRRKNEPKTRPSDEEVQQTQTDQVEQEGRPPEIIEV